MAQVFWTQKQDVGPHPRLGHALTYDAARKRVVLFGGDSLRSGLLGDTWTWDGENWTQVADTGPSPRREFAMVFDAARQQVLLFGGGRGDSHFGDTWQWDGENWTQVADSGPSARSGHAMAFDAVRKRAVLFGGESAANALAGDTWEWDGQQWVQREDTGPSPRRGHAMAYDNRHHRTVLFGGTTAGGVSAGDTWLWDGATWTQVAHFGLQPCLAAGMVFQGDAVGFFGGITSVQPTPAPRILGNTWEWDGKLWTQRQDIGPSARWSHSMAYDSDRQRTVLFGGLSAFGPLDDPNLPDNLLGDTWELPPTKTTATDFELVIGKATALFPRDGSTERQVEAALGNLVADAMRARYGTQLAIVTGGELRAALPSMYMPINHSLHRPSPGYTQGTPYDLVAGDIFTILPFGSLVLTRQVTGAQLWTALEQSVASEPAAFGGFAQISGFRVSYQLSADPGARVRTVQLDSGATVAADSQTHLTLAISSFAGTGGDGYSMFQDGQGIPQETIADVLMAYIQSRGTVAPSTSGRITQLP